MAERAGLFEGDLDLSQFTPQQAAKAERPPPEAVRAVAEGAKFQSREPSTPTRQRPQRRYRTGRNIQLNTKVTVSTRDGFYEVSDRYNWVLGETLERALQALRRELEKENPTT
ncbi:MAG: stability/partitioning determinant [Bryobacteraceae bacterium]